MNNPNATPTNTPEKQVLNCEKMLGKYSLLHKLISQGSIKCILTPKNFFPVFKRRPEFHSMKYNFF